MKKTEEQGRIRNILNIYLCNSEKKKWLKEYKHLTIDKNKEKMQYQKIFVDQA